MLGLHWRRKRGSPRPTLYWYLSADWAGDLEFILNQTGVPEPVLELTLPGRHAQGMHRLDLGKHGISLEKDIEYEWFVSIVLDPKQPSGNLLASATLRYIDLPAGLQARLEPLSVRPYVYAQAGLWYDAVDVLPRLIDADPENRALRLQRAHLSRQVNMPKVADYDE